MKQSFHFDIGNSDNGPIGFCARVIAESPAEAVAILKKAIDSVGFEGEHVVFDDMFDGDEPPVPGLEYIRVYFNPDHVSESDIDDSEEREDE